MKFVITVAFLLLTSLAAAQTGQVPDRVQQIAEALHARHLDLATGDDDQRRQLTKMIDEQVAFDLGPDWGWKSADPTRPPSKDSIAHRFQGRLYGCDWQSGETRRPMKPINCEDITGQHFIPVQPTNHLGNAPAPGEPPSPPTQPPSTGDLDEQIAALRAEFRAFRDDLRTQAKVLYDQGERAFNDLTNQNKVEAATLARIEAAAEAQRSLFEKIYGFVKDPKTILTILGLVAGRFALPSGQ